MIFEILSALGGVGTAAGMFLAYRARGESRDALTKANESAERARIAEAGTEAQRRRADDAAARVVTVEGQRKVATATAESLRSELVRERREKAELLERLAKAGVPVGDVVVDAALDHLFENEGGGEAGAGRNPGAGSGEDRKDVPGDDPATTDAADTLRLPR